MKKLKRTKPLLLPNGQTIMVSDNQDIKWVISEYFKDPVSRAKYSGKGVIGYYDTMFSYSPLLLAEKLMSGEKKFFESEPGLLDILHDLKPKLVIKKVPGMFQSRHRGYIIYNPRFAKEVWHTVRNISRLSKIHDKYFKGHTEQRRFLSHVYGVLMGRYFGLSTKDIIHYSSVCSRMNLGKTKNPYIKNAPPSKKLHKVTMRGLRSMFE